MNHNKEDVLPETVGLWPEILQSLGGLSADIFNQKKEHPCPLCGGTTRFRYIEKHTYPFFCNQCGARSGINFYMDLAGIDFSTAINDVGDYLNLIPTEQRERISRETIATSSFPKWYRFEFDVYQKINNECEFKLSPWQRVNALNMLDLLGHGKYTMLKLLDKSGEKCDYVMIDVDSNIKTTGGNAITPSGFYSVFGEDAGKRIYLTAKPLAAACASLFMGVEVVCCYSIENMDSVLNNFNGRECFAIVSDVTETTEADDLQLPQLIFNSKTRQVGKKVWQPGEIIKSKGK